MHIHTPKKMGKLFIKLLINYYGYNLTHYNSGSNKNNDKKTSNTV